MPKWTEYITKTKLDDNDELMILSTSEKANKRIRFSAVWDWIVDKLASAVVSKLTTTDKTVVGAINELNLLRKVNSLFSFFIQYNCVQQPDCHF